MKLEVCTFSGGKIYPGHGRRYVRIDGRTAIFMNNKCQSLYHQRKNPRKISWTVLFRRKHKKGTTEEMVKRRSRRNQKFSRAIQGATLEAILSKRNQTTEVRKAQREHQVRASKEKAKAAQALKKTLPKGSNATKAPKVVKATQGKAPRVGGKR
eukprot:comp24909_c0_seq1/m.60970 comp24909_c0_seq1/g.60970  ORF comp24909_c0_seq1/g.60970 comp24909_c0_seq1/m.60970 type:complete len:154 (-) comp24909_c0_seq1:8-469(-)